MATNNYLFAKDQYIGGESVESTGPVTVKMDAGDYGAYDTVTQKFSLYPSAGDYGIVIYVPTPVITSLVASGVMGATGALPGGLPTAH